MYLVIESGATTMRGLFVEETGRVKYSETGPGANPNDSGWTEVSNRVKELAAKLVRMAASKEGAIPQPGAIAIGLAGAGSADAADRGLTIAESLFPGCPAVSVSDAEAALLGVSPSGRGIAIISGTGSMSIASSGDHKRIRAGGWGLATGDPGSGSWMGKMAIKHALAVEDGIQEEGPLSDAVHHLTGYSGRDLALWAARSSRKDIARLARCVMDTEKEEAASKRLVRVALDELTLLTRAVSGRVNWFGDNYYACATGGLFENWPSFKSRFYRRIKKIPGLVTLDIPAPALLGLVRAAALASDFAPPAQLTYEGKKND